MRLKSFLSPLYGNFSKEESDLFEKLLLELQEKATGFAPDSQYLQRLSLNRVISSSTLKKSEELFRWDKANEWIHSQMGEEFTFEGLVELNQVVTEKSGLRGGEVYASGHQFLPSQELLREIDHFTEFLLKRVAYAPVEFAFRVYVWVVSAHPFNNGNGRTARLAADKILLEAGFLPLCFADSLLGHVAMIEDMGHRNFLPQMRNFFHGALRAYSL